MSKENQTLGSLVDNIQREVVWRIKEISVLKGQIPREKNDKQDTLIRVGDCIALCTLGGFCKKYCRLLHSARSIAIIKIFRIEDMLPFAGP